MKPRLALNDYAGVIRAAVDGLGVAEAPSIICQQELRRGSLIVPLPAWQFEEVDLSAFYLTRRHRSRVVELFLEHLVAQAAEILEPGTKAEVSGPRAKGSASADPGDQGRAGTASMRRAKARFSARPPGPLPL